MATGETYNEQARLNGPAILELLSELEKRDKENKGKVQAGSIAGTGMGDPRGFGVVNATGNTVGKVEDLYVDPHTRQPHFAVLSLGNHTAGHRQPARPGRLWRPDGDRGEARPGDARPGINGNGLAEWRGRCRQRS